MTNNGTATRLVELVTQLGEVIEPTDRDETGRRLRAPMVDAEAFDTWLTSAREEAAATQRANSGADAEFFGGAVAAYDQVLDKIDELKLFMEASQPR